MDFYVDITKTFRTKFLVTWNMLKMLNMGSSLMV